MSIAINLVISPKLIVFTGSNAKKEALRTGVQARAQAAVDAGAMVNLDSAMAIFQAQTKLIIEQNMPVAEVGE